MKLRLSWPTACFKRKGEIEIERRARGGGRDLRHAGRSKAAVAAEKRQRTELRVVAGCAMAVAARLLMLSGSVGLEFDRESNGHNIGIFVR